MGAELVNFDLSKLSLEDLNELKKRVEEEVDAALKREPKTLWDMEDKVQEIKNKIGKEIMQGLIKLKKLKISTIV